MSKKIKLLLSSSDVSFIFESIDMMTMDYADSPDVLKECEETEDTIRRQIFVCECCRKYGNDNLKEVVNKHTKPQNAGTDQARKVYVCKPCKKKINNSGKFALVPYLKMVTKQKA